MHSPNNLLSLITVCIICLFPVILVAGDAENEYIIKKGDTLWGISSEKLGGPFQWPELWKANPQIKNPHRVYPGQKLNISDQAAEEERRKKQAKHAAAETIPVKPGHIITPEKITSKTIRPNKRKFLVSRETFLQGGYIYKTLTTDGSVIASPQDKTAMGRGDYIYVKLDEQVQAQKKFYVVSKPEELINPETDVTVGYISRIKGSLEILGPENGNTKALILESFEEIAAEDLLKKYTVVDLPFSAETEKRPPVKGGIVLKMFDTREMGGSLNIVYIDRGTSHGVGVGDILDVKTKSVPHIPAGTLQIINTGESASVAFVTKALREINIGDLVGN